MMLRHLLVLAAVTAAVTAPAGAQDTKPAVGTTLQAQELTPEELQEREARKACKVEICAVFHNRRPAQGDIACRVLKSWRKEQLGKMVEKAKVSWPWGKVWCTADIKLPREALIKAMTEDAYEAKFAKHQVSCEVEREKDGNAQIKFDFTPTVRFEKGKATKATLHWGKIEAPTLVKGAMWTATATDNTFNVLQSTVVEDINDFIENKCMEVKNEWAGK